MRQVKKELLVLYYNEPDIISNNLQPNEYSASKDSDPV